MRSDLRLKDCGVQFNKGEHSYKLNGQPLRGVTRRIRERLFADEYAAVDEETLMKAAARGHFVHEAIQRHDETGWEPGFEDICVSPLYAAVDGYAEVMAKEQLAVVANEHLVTDGHTYASAIDIVAEKDGDVTLIDVKTTYNVNREYVSWQLSVYAMMLEAANPGISIKRLACMWVKVRHDIVEGVSLIEVPRKDAELVKKMLYTEDALDYGLAAVDAELARLNWEKAQLDEKMEAARQQVQAIMETCGLTSWKSANAAYTYKAAGTQQKFDSTAFKAAEPETYKKFTKSVATKPTLAIRFAGW